MRILAVDPGLSGAWAAVHDGRVTGCGDMPTVGEGSQRRVSGVMLADLIAACHATLLVTEHVSAMPKQGVSSMFRFGRSLGAIDGAAGAMGLAIEYVAPTVWKRHFRLIGTEKEASRAKALDLCPHLAGELRRKKDHNRAEAILIGIFAAATWDAVRIAAPSDVGGDAGARWNAPTPDGARPGDGS